MASSDDQHNVEEPAGDMEQTAETSIPIYSRLAFVPPTKLAGKVAQRVSAPSTISMAAGQPSNLAALRDSIMKPSGPYVPDGYTLEQYQKEKADAEKKKVANRKKAMKGSFETLEQWEKRGAGHRYVKIRGGETGDKNAKVGDASSKIGGKKGNPQAEKKDLFDWGQAFEFGGTKSAKATEERLARVSDKLAKSPSKTVDKRSAYQKKTDKTFFFESPSKTVDEKSEPKAKKGGFQLPKIR
jgi:hypothetical protein